MTFAQRGGSFATPTRTLVLVLTMSLVLALGAWQLLAPPPERPSAQPTSGERLILPTLRVPADPSFQFRQLQPGSTTPVAFDPCRPIPYVVRADGAPANSSELLTAALASVSAATGLQFVDNGATDETPSEVRANFLPERYGDRWAPVLIAWSSPLEYPGLSGPVIALAGNQPVTADDDGQLALVSGQVVLDTEQLTELLTFNSGRSVAIATITHELGHLVGLAHVNDERQLMYPSARPLVTSFGAGDLTGLAALGTGRCFDSL